MPIFDQGYQHWSGALSGHAWRWYTVTRHGVRVGMKNRFLRILMIVAWLPAAGLAFMLCVWGLHERGSDLVKPLLNLLGFMGADALREPLKYRLEYWTICYSTFLNVELRFSMILVLLVGPGLISQDLRFNALPLYFSRPLRRIDYFVGKLGVIAAFLGMILIVPTLVAYALGLLFSLDLSIIPDTIGLLLAAVGYGVVMTLSAGLFVLGLSSLSRNSRYIALFWLAVWFVSSIVAAALTGINEQQRMHARYQRVAEARQAEMNARPRPGAMTPQEQMRQQQEAQKQQQKIWAEFQKQELEESKSDWRPLVSYTANLTRIGQQMLRIDNCWRRPSEKLGEEEKQFYLREFLGPQYPWYWSAAVLAVLAGISLCILNFRVRSLDRLR
jgi:ABC-2 type transport system permease protein